MTTKAERIEQARPTIEQAERALVNIRGELTDVLAGIKRILVEGPTMGTYGDFAAGFDLTIRKTIKPALAQLHQCDHQMNNLEHRETYESLAPHIDEMMKRVYCETCE